MDEVDCGEYPPLFTRALLAEVNTDDVVLVMENAHYSSLCHAVVVEFLDAFDAEMC